MIKNTNNHLLVVKIGRNDFSAEIFFFAGYNRAFSNFQFESKSCVDKIPIILFNEICMKDEDSSDFRCDIRDHPV